MTPDKAQQIYAALDSIKAQWNALHPLLLDAKKRGTIGGNVIAKYNEGGLIVGAQLTTIRNVAASDVVTPPAVQPPKISSFTVTATDLAAAVDSGGSAEMQMRLAELPDEQCQLTVTTSAGEAIAVAKA